MTRGALLVVGVATLLNIRRLAGSVSVAGWSLPVPWVGVFPTYLASFFLLVNLGSPYRIFILGLTDWLNHNSSNAESLPDITEINSMMRSLNFLITLKILVWFSEFKNGGFFAKLFTVQKPE